MATWNTPLTTRSSALTFAFSLVLACLLLTGCDGESYGQLRSLSQATGALPGDAVVGQRWSYQPPISSADDDNVTVSASNLPDWINLDPSTGLLEGTPGDGDVRTWSNIQLMVNNGQETTTLRAFSVTVLAAGAAMGSANVHWTAPSVRVDGSPIGDLAGYRVLYGQSSRDYDHVVEISSAGINRHVIDGLGEGTWYFAVQAITSDGLTSAPSREVSKTI